MKNIGKILGVCMGCCFLVAGCNRRIAPEETAQILYNFYIQEDMTDIKQLGLTQEEAEDIMMSGIESFEAELEAGLKQIAGDYEVTIQKDNVKEAIELRRALEKTLSSEVEVISEERDSVQIKLHTTYFDEENIYNTASAALEERMKEVELEDEAEFVQQCIDVYLEEIIEAYKAAEVSTDKKSLLVEFMKRDGQWLPKGEQAFIDQMTNLTSGYEAE